MRKTLSGNEQMKFSIVTPTYNHADYIETTIKSVVNQSYDNYEYIVIDGNSTDRTKDIVQQYSDSIDTFISEPDDGQADAINKGLEKATGDIYAYLNSDDYYFSHALEKVRDIFAHHPEVDVVYGNCVFVDKEGNYLRYFSEIEPYRSERLLNNSDFIMQPATFWRAEAYKKYGPFNKDYHYGFDWAFWCEMAKHNCNFYYCNDVLAVNREFTDTKTLSGGDKRLAELKVINNKYKTSVLPHAYYSYAFSELKSNPDKNLLDYVKLAIYRVLSYSNLFYVRKIYHSKIINGVYPNTNFLNKKAIVTFPCYSVAKKIQLEMNTPLNQPQNMKVYLNDDYLMDYEFKKGPNTIEFDIHQDVLDIKITFVFEKEYQIRRRFTQRLRTNSEYINASARLLSLKVMN